MKTIVPILLLIAMPLAGCSGELLTPADEPAEMTTLSASKNGKAVPRPLKGRFVQDEVRITEGCNEGLQPTVFDIRGNATHLGQFTGTTFDCFNFVPISIDPPTFEFVDGEATLIAANGDRLYIEYTGIAIIPVFIPGGMFTVEYSGPITGGTGRFDGATGDVTFTGAFIFNPAPEGEGTFEGTIVY